MTHARHATYAHARPRSPTESSTFVCRDCVRLALLPPALVHTRGFCPTENAPPMHGPQINTCDTSSS